MTMDAGDTGAWMTVFIGGKAKWRKIDYFIQSGSAYPEPDLPVPELGPDEVMERDRTGAVHVFTVPRED